jgi:hypothetical protein
MISWPSDVEKVKEGKASNIEYINAITYWLSTDIPQSTEGMYEAISRRVVWVFPNGYAFAVGTNFNPVFYHLSKKVQQSDLLPFDDFNSDWRYAPQANGWQYNGNGNNFLPADKIANFVEIFTTKYGVPQLTLPWDSSWVEQIVDQGEDYYYEWDDDDAEESINLRLTMYQLAELANNGVLVNHSPWKTSIADEEAELSEHSDYMKFRKLVALIEEHKLAILDLDQHCSGCGGGTYEYAVKYDPELEGKPIFRTWSQNSEWMWRGDGSIYLEVYMPDENSEKEIKKLAVEIGFDFDLDEDGEPEVCGSIDYES